MHHYSIFGIENMRNALLFTCIIYYIVVFSLCAKGFTIKSIGEFKLKKTIFTSARAEPMHTGKMAESSFRRQRAVWSKVFKEIWQVSLTKLDDMGFFKMMRSLRNPKFYIPALVLAMLGPAVVATDHFVLDQERKRPARARNSTEVAKMQTLRTASPIDIASIAPEPSTPQRFRK